MIAVRQVLTATTGDVLNGTDLENLPGAGVLVVLAASSQADGTLTITGRGFEVPVREQPLPLRTNGQPSQQDDAPIVIPIPVGGKVLLDYTEVTAATAVIEATFLSIVEAGGMRR
jgi:hypothetical protein